MDRIAGPAPSHRGHVLEEAHKALLGLLAHGGTEGAADGGGAGPTAGPTAGATAGVAPLVALDARKEELAAQSTRQP